MHCPFTFVSKASSPFVTPNVIFPTLLSCPTTPRGWTFTLYCEPAAAQGLDNMLTLSLFDAQGSQRTIAAGIGTMCGMRLTPRRPAICLHLPPGAWIVQINARGDPARRCTTRSTLKSALRSTTARQHSRRILDKLPPARSFVARNVYAAICIATPTIPTGPATGTVTQLIQAAHAVDLDFLFLTGSQHHLPAGASGRTVQPRPARGRRRGTDHLLGPCTRARRTALELTGVFAPATT